jgi:hypothetical protein
MWSDAPKSIIHAILETNVEIFKTYHCHLRPSQQYHPLHVFQQLQQWKRTSWNTSFVYCGHDPTSLDTPYKFKAFAFGMTSLITMTIFVCVFVGTILLMVGPYFLLLIFERPVLGHHG